MPELFDILRLAIEILGVALFGMGIGVQPCCCGGSNCPHCSGDAPEELEITIAGLTQGQCYDCESLNDTYVLQFIGDGPAGCCWIFDFEDICTFNRLAACISHPIALEYQLEVAFGRSGGTSDVIVYLDGLGDYPPDCKSWSGLMLPVTSQTQAQCDDLDSTCEVTAV